MYASGGGYSRKEDSYNYGAAVLKIIMSFEVVLCHYWLFENISDIPVYLRIFDRLRLLAVPTFMIMSFYFITDSALTKDIGVYNARIGRLLSPYIGWAVIYYLGYLMLELIFDIELVGGIRDLICQLLFGNSIHLIPPLWFQADLILLTGIVFIIFYFIPTNKAFNVLAAIAFLSLWMQYSGINYSLFGEWAYEVRYTYGRVAEMMPYACVGMAFSYNKIEQKISISRFGTIACACMLIFLFRFPVFYMPELNFGYGGLYFICIASVLVLFFMVIPLNTLPIKVLGMIKWFARYTPGIFYIHYGIGNLFRRRGQTGDFIQCVIIWIISFVIAFLISKIPLKICKGLVK
ncbi:MAG: acyltransferase [Lachnospiraceae bacterium]|nr:acyltransferase [Lachnospiraceae bacterium]